VLAKGEEELQDEEPFAADWSARTALAQRVLPHLLRGEALSEIRTCAHAGVEYPPGKAGGIELDRELQQMEAFARQLAPVLQLPTVEPVSGTVEFVIDDECWRISGGYGDLRADGLCRYRYDDTRAGDYLEGWINHLLLNELAPAGVNLQTIWHSRDGRYVLRPMEGARGQLEALVRLYRDGLHAPIHFFPKSAWKFITADQDPAKAAAAWRSTLTRPWAEDSDPAYRLALRGVDDPLDDKFAANAAAVFSPLLAVIDDERLA
jgi:exodeoxyribonuclease V gamma subunit